VDATSRYCLGEIEIVEALLIPFALLVGGLLAVQAAANLQLSRALGSPVGGSTLQLGIAAVLLTALAALAGTLNAFAAIPAAEPWHLLGGLGSAIYVTAGILLFPRLGALVSVGLFVAGQMLASLVVDGLGLLGVERTGFSLAGLTGGGAVIAGIVLVVLAQVRASGPASGPAAGQAVPGRHLGWVLFGLVAGAALPLQGAVNAQLRADVGAPFTVGGFSFVVSTAVMAVVLLGMLARRQALRPRLGGLRELPWWGWLGGLVGATYVVAVFLLIPEIGAATTVGLTVAGQQLASLLVDQFGLLRLPKRPLTLARLAGVALLLAGVVLIRLT
jgi:bacterial/archaeal transporter family-2 protein